MATGDRKPVVMEADIVNDLTTGGASMALSAEMGKVLKNEVDAITPESIGAIAWDNRSSLVGVDILEWALEQKNPTTIGVGSDVTNMPTNGTWWTVELNIAGNSSWRTLIAWQATVANIVKYERRHINGTWSVWKQIATTDYALPLDGSKAMTGELSVNNGQGVVKAGNGSSQLEHYPTAGSATTNIILGIRAKDTLDKIARLYHTVDNATTVYNILHTGNKPSGSYTGNGDATKRTIETGGIGSVCEIHSLKGKALVTYYGAIVARGDTVFNVDANNVNFRNGVLSMLTTDDAFNANSTTYYYNVL